jgi:hypothetical protein
VHVQQSVEAPAAQRAMHGGVTADSATLVEHDELDAFEAAQQRVLGFTDDPRERCVRPRSLDRTHDRDRVTGVADGREADDAKRRGGVAERQLHAGVREFQKTSVIVHDRRQSAGLAKAAPEQWDHSTAIGNGGAGCVTT